MSHNHSASLLKHFVDRDFTSYEDFRDNYRVKIPDNFNFGFDVVDEMAGIAPAQRALHWINEKGDTASFTFADIKKYSNKAASALVKLGIKKGDPVMLILKRRYEFWFLCVALHKIGAICIPATHMLTVKDITYRNNAADIKMIITTEEDETISNVEAASAHSPTLKLKAALHTDKPGWININTAIDEGSENFQRPSGNDVSKNSDFFLTYFTSGTTGMPKMVKHNFTYPLGHILTAAYWQNVIPGGLHLTVADTGWAKAAWGKIYGQWICGTAVMVYDYDKFVPKKLLDVVADSKVTTFCAPPTIYRYFIKEDLTGYNFSALKHCTVAGEPLNPEVYNQFLKQTGHKIKEGFGQTETVVAVATYPWLEPKPGSMGKPTPGFDIDLLNDDDKPCEAGEEGRLVIRTANGKAAGMFDEYYRDEALTKKVWNNGIYQTGDMAYRDEDGYYWFVGRADDCFKSSGYRIGPFEIESALLEHPAVLECAITAVPDPDRGLVAKATVVPAKGFIASDELIKALQEHVKKVTAPYKYPRIVEFVSELPKTISGKIRRVEIRKSGK
ncbi:MAG: acetyl-CoA synthetase [Candidatus Goldiibacteriota bacterium HGW-Goldbacteria-1]|jgi:acetyl-CoA synthetase|nr:MAG: acetyl-CoA synthetase [Candidatus Goldiibacteriota bacterium HGW-Goldbacteria-1]